MKPELDFINIQYTWFAPTELKPEIEKEFRVNKKCQIYKII